jgi:hypothetical protein
VSYGTVRTYKSKKAFREDVEARGAENVEVYGTSMFGNETASTVAELADVRNNVVVGPDVFNKRDWYANVVRNSKGQITIK